MSWENEDEGYEERGDYSRRGKSAFGGTSNFNTTMLSDDRRFLGIKLSRPLAEKLNFFRGAIIGWISDKGEQYSIPLAEKIARRFTKNEAKAFKAAGKVGSGVAYSLIFLDEILSVGGNIYDTTNALNDLRTAVKPLTKSGSSISPLSGDNEVIANARSKINGIFWMRTVDTATGMITVLPAFISRLGKKKIENERREKNREFEHAKNSEELADLLEKDLVAGGTTAKGSAEQMHEAHKIVIARRRTKYEDRLRAYVKEGMGTAEKQLGIKVDEAIAAIRNNDYEHGVEILSEHGFNTDALFRRIGGANDKNAGQVADALQAVARASLGQVATRNLTKTYVGQEGAFDHNYTQYLDSDGSRYEKPTIKGKLEAQLEKRIEARAQAERSAHDKNRGEPGEMGKAVAGLGAAAVSELTQKAIGEQKLKKLSQPIAIDRILHLRRVLEKAGDNPPEIVPGIRFDDRRNERDMGYIEFVHTIFQQHQRDSGRPDIGERFFEHFKDTDFNDEAILRLPDEQLTAYEYAVKTIAKRIKDGRMDAIALVNLVGDKEKKIVKSDGRSFGSKGVGKDEAAVKEALLHVIDEQTALAHAGQKKTDSDINEKLGNFVFSVDDLKKALESDTLDKQQRAFLFTVFSDVVGNEKELCKMLGIDEKRCAELRKETKDTFNATLDGAVLALADVFQADPDLETKLKLTGKEKDVILSLAERIKQEGKDVADLTVDRQELKTLETVVANAVMKDKEGLWAKMVEKARDVPNIIAEAKKRRTEKLTEQPMPDEAGPGFAKRFDQRDQDGAGRFASDEGPQSLVDRASREEPLVPGGRGA